MTISRLLFSFQGRITRATFWYFTLTWFLVSIAVSALDQAMGTYDYAYGNGCLTFLFMLCTAVPGWAVGVKRAHDRARPNWFLFLGLIPIIGQLWLLVELGFLRGTNGPNKYGPDPTARAHSRLPNAVRA